MSAYLVAEGVIYWRFPSEAQRLAYSIKANEANRIALEEDTGYFFLSDFNGSWLSLGSGASPRAYAARH